MEDVPQRDDRASRAVPESGNDESESDSGMTVYDSYLSAKQVYKPEQRHKELRFDITIIHSLF